MKTNGRKMIVGAREGGERDDEEGDNGGAVCRRRAADVWANIMGLCDVSLRGRVSLCGPIRTLHRRPTNAVRLNFGVGKKVYNV